MIGYDGARQAGRFAFDTETTSLDAMHAGLVGLSLAVTPGEACYVPLGHTGPGNDLIRRRRYPPAAARDRRSTRGLEAAARRRVGPEDRAEHQVRRAGHEAPRHRGRAARRYDADLLRARRRPQRGTEWTTLAERHLGHTCMSFSQVMEHAPGAKKSEKTFAASAARQGDRIRRRRCRRDAAPVDGAEAASRRRAHDDGLRDAGAGAGSVDPGDGARRHQGRPRHPLAPVQSTFAQRARAARKRRSTGSPATSSISARRSNSANCCSTI